MHGWMESFVGSIHSNKFSPKPYVRLTNHLLHLTEKMSLTRLDPIWIYFISVLQTASPCITNCNSVYYQIATSYNDVYYLHHVTVIRYSWNISSCNQCSNWVATSVAIGLQLCRN